MSLKSWLPPTDDMPTWLAILDRTALVIALCAWLVFVWLIISGTLFEHERLTKIAFGVFAACAVLQLIVRLRSFLRWAVGKEEL